MRKIRIFRYRREKGEYSFSDYEGTFYMKERLRTEDGGVKRCWEGSVRIMTDEDIDARPGDYISLYGDSEPNKGRDYMITAIRDNRRGGLPHWRIVMEVAV